MCGIAGVMMRGGAPADAAPLGRMIDALAHRGPDDRGLHIEGAVGLGHTRLSIIDLATGHQPLVEPGGCKLVANGEIYNDPELRAELAGAPFATGSDCESALHLYLRDGPAFAAALRGMYAIALWDPTARRLLLARDPFGIKPLYIAETEDALAFASEPQALIAAGFATARVDPLRRAELLQLKFTTGRPTIFPGVSRVLPGETLVIEDGRIIERRQRAALPPGPPRKARDPALLAQLDTVLMDTVEHHLRSDVPYGLFLSGGIDSAVLATAMARLRSQPIVALTAGFPGGVDETAQAQRVATAVGADHHVITMTAEDFWAEAPRIAACLDDPTTDAAALPTYLLGRAARGLLKVVLSGEGADEMFGGYGRYRRASWFGLVRRTSRNHGVFDRWRAPGLGGWRDGLADDEDAAYAGGRGAIQGLQAMDCGQWLPNDLLVKADRCLMAHGVEGRTPFLDPVVADFAFRLPDRAKVRGRFGKWLLREWLASALPEAAAFAKKKGFNPPVGAWIAAGDPAVHALIAHQPGLAAVLAPELSLTVLAQAATRSQAAWSLVFYALWHSRHVLGVSAEGTVEAVLSEAKRRA
jgi:asparagine synthase (glutamine-hydrolysing)